MTSVSKSGRTASAGQTASSAKLRWTLFALTFAMVLAFLDRQLLNLFVDPIRAEFGLSDLQFSLLQGLAFALVYSLGALPIAHLSDVSSQRVVIVTSVAAWSAMTVLFGCASSFAMLFVARAGVALGETGLSPAATSLIRAVFPASAQGKAVGVFSSGVYIGGGLALVIGGPLAAWLVDGGAASLGLSAAPWRIVFVAAGCLGLAGVVFTILLPRVPPLPRQGHSASFRAFLSVAWANRLTVGLYLGGMSAFLSIVAALTSWTPTLFTRIFSWSAADTGIFYGMSYSVGGILGTIVGGVALDRIEKNARRHGVPIVLCFAALVLTICGTLAPLVASPWLALSIIAIAMGAIGSGVGIGAYGFAMMFERQFSSRAVALYLLVCATLGGTLGPTLVPLFGRGFGSGDNIRMPLAVTTLFLGAVALICLFSLWRYRQARPTEFPTAA